MTPIPKAQPPAVPTAERNLGTVVTDVLGELAFMVNDGTEAIWPSGVALVQGEIHYRGPISGCVRCWCTPDFATQLAANLLGVEPGTDDAQAASADAVGEFLNVLCGQLVTAWYGTEAVFDLDIPSATVCSEVPAADASSADAYAQLSIDGQPLRCTHAIEPAVGA
jgi:CheY-specific phosphatase CheX